MDLKQIVIDFWEDMNNQNWDKLSPYFSETAMINWHNTNESFSVSEFVLVNSHYPGDWLIKVENLVTIDNIVISVIKIQLKDHSISFYATSFFEFKAEKIEVLDEYFGENAQPPQWRIAMQLGASITS